MLSFGAMGRNNRLQPEVAMENTGNRILNRSDASLQQTTLGGS
jgi:hypothetical protein